MKKSTFVAVLSVVMALLIASIPTLQVVAADSKNNVEYIAEIKIGVGETSDEAAKALDGYTILKDGNNYVDLNQKAGGGIGSKGERVVYLGYKTTTERTEAITDLAVMNMKGGYSVKDYELLMEQYMTEQIIPFVNNFLATIKEYRENYNSDNEENKARAQYVHDALNKLTDDDCGGVGLGDLLLNETKYEMGDAAYNALSETEKMKHADIVTIISQANGKATFMMENLITRAADTNEETWIDRFVGITYEDLFAIYPDMLPSEAEAQLAKDYDNDAREILSMWSTLKEKLDEYEENKEKFDEFSQKDLTSQQEIVNNYNSETATEDEKTAFVQAYLELNLYSEATTTLGSVVTLKEYLETISYGEETLLDFFEQDYETVKNDITVLYPLVASLTEGQRAGLLFVTLIDLVTYAVTDSEGYKDAEIDALEQASIYENVDREIYKAGGVALTSEALRAHSAEEAIASDSQFSQLSRIMQYVAAGSLALFAGTALVRLGDMAVFNIRKAIISNQIKNLETAKKGADYFKLGEYDRQIRGLKEDLYGYNDGLEKNGIANYYEARSAVMNKMLIGFGIAAVILSGIALYFSYRDLVDYYHVDYTPIPKYMVDEKDITTYNEKGEKVVIKNQAAYYKAVGTNRAENDEWFDILGTSADLNGTVGRQWIALYAAQNENMSPIIATSLKAVVGKNDVPADYTTGIHMFGSDSAFNLNDTRFVWNNEAPSVFVYFKVDASASSEPSTTGSSFSAGYLVLTGVIGLVIGAGLGALVMLSSKRKKTGEA